MKPTIYIESTIPSYLAARTPQLITSLTKQIVTKEWWEDQRHDFRLFVSSYVIEEVSSGNPGASRKRLDFLSGIEILAIDETVISLTNSLMNEGLFPSEYATDAAHVAIASRYGIEFLLTWNCRHLANPFQHAKISKVIEDRGYRMPLVCTPMHFSGGNSSDI